MFSAFLFALSALVRHVDFILFVCVLSIPLCHQFVTRAAAASPAARRVHRSRRRAAVMTSKRVPVCSKQSCSEIGLAHALGES
jgi:hypothetical protein